MAARAATAAARAATVGWVEKAVWEADWETVAAMAVMGMLEVARRLAGRTSARRRRGRYYGGKDCSKLIGYPGCWGWRR